MEYSIGTYHLLENRYSITFFPPLARLDKTDDSAVNRAPIIFCRRGRRRMAAGVTKRENNFPAFKVPDRAGHRSKIEDGRILSSSTLGKAEIPTLQVNTLLGRQRADKARVNFKLCQWAPKRFRQWCKSFRVLSIFIRIFLGEKQQRSKLISICMKVSSGRVKTFLSQMQVTINAIHQYSNHRNGFATYISLKQDFLYCNAQSYSQRQSAIL